jgi:hypothetical protein
MAAWVALDAQSAARSQGKKTLILRIARLHLCQPNTSSTTLSGGSTRTSLRIHFLSHEPAFVHSAVSSSNGLASVVAEELANGAATFHWFLS